MNKQAHLQLNIKLLIYIKLCLSLIVCIPALKSLHISQVLRKRNIQVQADSYFYLTSCEITRYFQMSGKNTGQIYLFDNECAGVL